MLSTRLLTYYPRVLSFTTGRAPLAVRAASFVEDRRRHIKCSASISNNNAHDFGCRYFSSSSRSRSNSDSNSSSPDLPDDKVFKQFLKYIKSNSNDDDDETLLADKTFLRERSRQVEDILQTIESKEENNYKYRGRDYIYHMMRKAAPSKNKRRAINKDSAVAKLYELVYTRHALRHGQAKLKLLKARELSESFLGPDGRRENVHLDMAKKILKEQWRWGHSALLQDLERKVAERQERRRFQEERAAANRKRKRQEQQQQQQASNDDDD